MPQDLINETTNISLKDFLLHHNFLNLWIKQILYLNNSQKKSFTLGPGGPTRERADLK